MKKLGNLIIFGDKWDIFERDMSLEDYCGRCYYDKKELHIHNEYKESNPIFLETVLHEYFHALFRRMSYYQSIPHALEEVMVDQISKSLTENFKISLKNKSK